MAVLAAAVLAVLAWGYLFLAHGGYWRTSRRLPPGSAAARPEEDWPVVVAVVPARDEADVLPLTLPSLLGQDYAGEFSVVLVDDGSTDGTGEVAASLARRAAVPSRAGRPDAPGGDGVPGGEGAPRADGRPARHGTARLRVVQAVPPPPGWAGKVWAMTQGVRSAGDCEFYLFTDADIAWAPGSVTDLVRAACGGELDLVSLMALLRADTGWERFIVPAFVYFFAQLYPFRRVSRAGSRTAAAAGGCMLVRRTTLAAAGGLAGIAGARIDDVALARLLKRSPVRGRCWLGFTTTVRSRRAYPALADLWHMIARSAYTQLRYSPALLLAVVAGLLVIYVVPPAAGTGGLIAWAAGGGTAARWDAVAGLAAWVLMTVTYLPVLRLYRLSAWRAPTLPLIALLYAAMTVDSARRHRSGRGGEWKGRTWDPTASR